MKKRNKKYIPLAEKMQRKMQAKLNHFYEFDMTFCIEDVNYQINQWHDANHMPDDAYCPEWLVIDTYQQQDLIIALKMQQVQSPEYWEIAIASHFINADATDVHTINFYIELPTMSHEQLMSGCEVKVNRGAGIKTRWKGLQDEMIDHWKNEGCPDGYELVKSETMLKAQAKFKNAQMLNEHEAMLKWRSEGALIARLKSFGRLAA